MVLIRRYANRKLYDTSRRHYCSLREIGEMVLAGADVRIVDYATQADITGRTLARVIAAQPRVANASSDEACGAEVDIKMARRIATLNEDGGLEPNDATRLLLLWSTRRVLWTGLEALTTRTDCLQLAERIDDLNREVCRLLSRRAGADSLRSEHGVEV